VSFICSNESTTLTEIIKFMFSFTEIKKKSNISISSSEKVMRYMRDLETSIDVFSRSRGSLQEIKSVLEKQFNKIFTDLLSVEHTFLSNLRNIKSALLETSILSKENKYTLRSPLGSNQASNLEPEQIDTRSSTPDVVDIPRPQFMNDEAIEFMIIRVWESKIWKSKLCDNKKNTWALFNDFYSLKFKAYKNHVCFALVNDDKKVLMKDYKKFNSDTYAELCEECNIAL
jgi:hypothetical protein